MNPRRNRRPWKRGPPAGAVAAAGRIVLLGYMYSVTEFAPAADQDHGAGDPHSGGLRKGWACAGCVHDLAAHDGEKPNGSEQTSRTGTSAPEAEERLESDRNC